ncbi:RNA polymerase sigma factor [Sediminibacter sp. Hel_I_10]|uniref:RNA polymerase sigma factor n=1 Tax=Sediminibacter sp. Hel_I_10 TaxID=1392490 RepID=UPI00056B648E|nr:RNA polymerase sigma factor [Sediminibacter sp. Hel_I_10]
MTLTHQNIAQLLQKCEQGHQQAQLEIYNRYYQAMFNTSLRIVKDRFEAEDIMQDSFLTAFTKLGKLKDHNMFGAWLKRIVINNSISHYKKNMVHPDVPLEEVLYKIEHEHQGIDETEVFSNLKAKQVLEVMKSLKDNYKISLTLHLIEGYDYQEICEIMEISHANCRTMISRAKASLRQKMELMLN